MYYILLSGEDLAEQGMVLLLDLLHVLCMSFDPDILRKGTLASWTKHPLNEIIPDSSTKNSVSGRFGDTDLIS